MYLHCEIAIELERKSEHHILIIEIDLMQNKLQYYKIFDMHLLTNIGNHVLLTYSLNTKLHTWSCNLQFLCLSEQIA